MRSRRRRQLKIGEKRQQNENRARVNDLPLEMLPIGLIEAHARGRVSYACSLTSREKFVAESAPGRNGGQGTRMIAARIPANCLTRFGLTARTRGSKHAALDESARRTEQIYVTMFIEEAFQRSIVRGEL